MRQPDQFPDTRTTLIRRLTDDTGEAWRTFFDVYGPLVFRIARRAGLNANDAEDVLACVMRNFVQAVERGFELDHRVGLFRSYLKTITTNEIRAHRRRERRSSELGERVVSAVEPSVAVRWEDAERQNRWQLCLERLRESASVRSRDYEAFVRYALNGEPAEQVAAELQVTVDRLYGIKHTMVRKARRMWQQLEQELGEV